MVEPLIYHVSIAYLLTTALHLPILLLAYNILILKEHDSDVMPNASQVLSSQVHVPTLSVSTLYYP